jgi:hypothetical protein
MGLNGCRHAVQLVQSRCYDKHLGIRYNKAAAINHAHVGIHKFG